MLLRRGLADRAVADRAARGRVRPSGRRCSPKGLGGDPLQEPVAGAGREVRRHRHRARSSAGSRRSRSSGSSSRLVAIVGPRRSRSGATGSGALRGALRGPARAARRRGALPVRSPVSCGRAQPALFAAQRNIGPERARQSRYVYIVVGDGAAGDRDRGRRDRTPLAAAHDSRSSCCCSPGCPATSTTCASTPTKATLARAAHAHADPRRAAGAARRSSLPRDIVARAVQGAHARLARRQPPVGPDPVARPPLTPKGDRDRDAGARRARGRSSPNDKPCAPLEYDRWCGRSTCSSRSR